MQNPNNPLKTDEDLDAARYALAKRGFTVDVTGDACVGDEIAFAEARFSGWYRNATFLRYEIIEGTISGDNYGAKKQQHTFSIQLNNGEVIHRKGRKIYKYWTLAKPRNEEERAAALTEKHARGDEAREARRARLDGEERRRKEL